MSPSYHHAYLAGNLITAFNSLKKYSVFSELTLQIGEKDFIPDICLFRMPESRYIHHTYKSVIPEEIFPETVTFEEIMPQYLCPE